MNNGVFLLTLGLLAFFGAGVVDVTCPDVIPIRPYSSLFLTGLAFKKRQSSKNRYNNPNHGWAHSLSQINEPLEIYVARKRKAFAEKYKIE